MIRCTMVVHVAIPHESWCPGERRWRTMTGKSPEHIEKALQVEYPGVKITLGKPHWVEKDE